jgi:hypothetical protein
MKPLSLFIEGVAFWTPAAPGWEAARAALCSDDEQALADAPGARPAPSMLAANERRRAPDSVLVALEVAGAALAQSGRPAGAVASVFASAHGDLPIADALCRTLATDPLLLSPTRFHHSVHNAASGYWAIASGSRAASTALAAYDLSFAAGLLEAASQCAADQIPVLLVGCDTQACGPMISVNSSRGLLGLALLLSGERSAAARFSLEVNLQAGQAAAPALRSPLARSVSDNAIGDGLPLFEALASGTAVTLALGLSRDLQLGLRLHPLSS